MTTVFYSTIDSLDKANVLIYNLLGKLVLSKNISDNSTKIEIQDKFQSGIYIVKVVSLDDNKVYHTKLVIE